jgi:hypothetical protein
LHHWIAGSDSRVSDHWKIARYVIAARIKALQVRISGFVYDVTTGQIETVVEPSMLQEQPTPKG